MKPSQVSANLRQIASRIKASKKPDKGLVIKDLRKIVSSILDLPSEPDMIKHKKAEQILYGRTNPFSTAEDAPEGERAGSLLFWSAFEELNIVDWTPYIDPELVFKKTREIAERLKAEQIKTTGSSVLDPDREEQEARDNWDSYATYYADPHAEKLVAAGLR